MGYRIVTRTIPSEPWRISIVFPYNIKECRHAQELADLFSRMYNQTFLVLPERLSEHLRDPS